jgi:hypothetical protein
MLSVHLIWYLLPLILSVSLVYGATRHELPGPILEHAYKSGVWMVTFMFCVFAGLFLFDWWMN